MSVEWNPVRCAREGCGKHRGASIHRYDTFQTYGHFFVSPSEPEVGPCDCNSCRIARGAFPMGHNSPCTKLPEAVAPEPKPEPRECTTCGGPILTCCGKAESCCQCRM